MNNELLIINYQLSIPTLLESDYFNLVMIDDIGIIFDCCKARNSLDKFWILDFGF
ncbi:hypothetical protein NIES3275_23940 [Microchaete diplosiphon NIES-3275]|nr:hypothetical protein NIES3275_23940 [Microchaete diplosiphon NIES-3275]